WPPGPRPLAGDLLLRIRRSEDAGDDGEDRGPGLTAGRGERTGIARWLRGGKCNRRDAEAQRLPQRKSRSGERTGSGVLNHRGATRREQNERLDPPISPMEKDEFDR